jgi:hypothetical protein
LKERRRGEQWSGVCERRKKGQRTAECSDPSAVPLISLSSDGKKADPDGCASRDLVHWRVGPHAVRLLGPTC